MNNKKSKSVTILILSVFLLTIAGPVLSLNEPTIVYGNGWREITYPDGHIQYTDGVKTYFRYDSVYRPFEELNFETNQWPYKVGGYETCYLIQADGISFRLPKRNWIDYEFRLDRIKETMHIPTLQALVDRSIVHNETVRYIPFDFSASQVASVDRNLVELGRFKTKNFWIRDNGSMVYDPEMEEWYREYDYYDVANHYELKIVNDEIRLYFDDLVWFQNAQYPLVIDPTWTLEGAIGTAWTNVTHDNTTSVISTGNVELRKEVDDYVSHWRFDENTGLTAYDENITNTNDGTLLPVDSEPTWTTGKFGSALNINGTGDYVDGGNKDSLNLVSAVTVEMWIKCGRDPRDYNQVPLTKGVFNGATVAYNFYFRGTGDGIRFNVVDGASYANIAMPDDMNGNYYHLVGTYDQNAGSNQVNIYLNGVKGTPATETGNMAILPDVLYIGRDKSVSFHFKGTTDVVRIYNRALSNDEINATMDNSHYEVGNLTSIVKDADSDYVWQEVSFNASLPGNTNTSIYVNTSDDNSSFSGWELVQSNAVGDGTQYTIPAAYQKRYGHWRLELKGNVTETPAVEDVTFYSGEAEPEPTPTPTPTPTATPTPSGDDPFKIKEISTKFISRIDTIIDLVFQMLNWGLVLIVILVFFAIFAILISVLKGR